MNISPIKLLVVIPAYNTARFLDDLINRIKNTSPTCDILVVNDGSTDNTAEIAQNQNVNILSNTKNQGKGFSLKRGFAYAIEKNYDYLITIDADLQHTPEDMARFLKNCSNGSIVIGSRELTMQKMPLHRWLSNNITSLMVSIFGGKLVRDSQSGFRMFHCGNLKKIKGESNRFDFESELLLQSGLLDIDIKEIPVETIYGREESSISHIGDIFRFIKQIWKRIMI